MAHQSAIQRKRTRIYMRPIIFEREYQEAMAMLQAEEEALELELAMDAEEMYFSDDSESYESYDEMDLGLY